MSRDPVETEKRRRALGRIIRRERKAQGLSQKALAAAAGTTVNAVSTWELGKSEPGVTNLRAACRALGLSPEAISDEADRLATSTTPPTALSPSPEEPNRFVASDLARMVELLETISTNMTEIAKDVAINKARLERLGRLRRVPPTPKKTRRRA